MVSRWRDPHGRPAARVGRAAANHPDRRGGEDRARPIPATTRRRAGCGPPRSCWRSTRPGPRSGFLAPGARRAKLSAWPPSAGRSAASPCAPPRPLGGPLLDALDVSEPSFRIAAGIVAGLAGAADLFRRPPPPEPALAGRRAALVPVAIPLVARPALLVLALGAGADQGVLVCAGAMAIGSRAVDRAGGRRGRPRAPGGESSGGRAACWPPRS